jgi:hypothetical protein
LLVKQVKQVLVKQVKLQLLPLLSSRASRRSVFVLFVLVKQVKLQLLPSAPHSPAAPLCIISGVPPHFTCFTVLLALKHSTVKLKQYSCTAFSGVPPPTLLALLVPLTPLPHLYMHQHSSATIVKLRL